MGKESPLSHKAEIKSIGRGKIMGEAVHYKGEDMKTELIWVPGKVAKDYAKATDENAQLKVLEKLIADAKYDMTADLERLDEESAIFKSVLIKTRQELSKTLDEHIDATEKIWEGMTDKMPDFSKQADYMIESLETVETKINGFATLIRNVSENLDYGIIRKMKDLVEVAQQIANLDDKTRDILHGLFESLKEKKGE